MAKKRNLIPFYGKPEQAAEQFAHKLAREGKFKESGTIHENITKSLRAKRKAVFSRLAPWVPIPKLPNGYHGRWERGQIVPR